jgi:hypothetical protein
VISDRPIADRSGACDGPVNGSSVLGSIAVTGLGPGATMTAGGMMPTGGSVVSGRATGVGSDGRRRCHGRRPHLGGRGRRRLHRRWRPGRTDATGRPVGRVRRRVRAVGRGLGGRRGLDGATTQTVVVVFEVGVVATTVVPVLVSVEAARATRFVGSASGVVACAGVRLLRGMGAVAGAIGIGVVRRRSLVLARVLPSRSGMGGGAALAVHATAALVGCA